VLLIHYFSNIVSHALSLIASGVIFQGPQILKFVHHLCKRKQKLEEKIPEKRVAVSSGINEELREKESHVAYLHH